MLRRKTLLTGLRWVGLVALLGVSSMHGQAHAQKTDAAKGDTAKARVQQPAQPPSAFEAPLTDKVLRYAFRVAETGFDPAQISDLYSRTVVAGILEALFSWDYLASPAKMIPNVAEALPEVSADFKTFTVRIKKGIYFQDDAAFNGKRRELTADDVVFSYKRHYDPKLKSYAINTLEISNVLGMNELRAAAIKNKTAFNYDTPVDGVKALDRYTVQWRTGKPIPRFAENFTDPSLFGIVAREVTTKYGDSIMEHPVGTGPYTLGPWRRASKIVMLRNPTYREVFFNAEPAANDERGQQILTRLKGKRIPLNDRIEISILNEDQPRWLAFLNGEHDLIQEMPGAFAPIAIPNNKLAPNLAKRGIELIRTAQSDVTMSYFNMEDPVVGGYTPEKVALRRAISLAINVEEEIRLVRRGQAIAANQFQPPETTGFDPTLRTEMSEFSRERAKALLDMFGYIDKDGDGWRDMPDGKPLVLTCLTQADQTSRQLDELFKKQFNAVGIQIKYITAKWPDNLKKARSGKLQMWRLGFSATAPDPNSFVLQGYGPAKGENNLSRFDLPAYNALYEKQLELADGPERNAVIAQARDIMIAYMPYKIHTHRVVSDLMHPWVSNYKRHPFMRDIYKFVEVDAGKRVVQVGQ